eukprot:Gb_08275 [translate_table: standard]
MTSVLHPLTFTIGQKCPWSLYATQQVTKHSSMAQVTATMAASALDYRRDINIKQEVAWQDTMIFGASVHRGISFSATRDFQYYLHVLGSQEINLKFELWLSYSTNNIHQPISFQALESADAGKKGHLDGGKRPVISKQLIMRKSTQFCPGKEREVLIGTAILPLRDLLQLLEDKGKQVHSCMKVAHQFHLPIFLSQQWASLGTRTPKLVIEISYKVMEPEAENLLQGTIFSDLKRLNRNIQLPLKTKLSIQILQVADSQNETAANSACKWREIGFLVIFILLEHFMTLKGIFSCASFPCPEYNKETNGHHGPDDNFYVRFSLFPSNRELEKHFPPTVILFKVEELMHSRTSTQELPLIVNASVIKELWRSQMSFEVWKHRTITAQYEAADVLIGTAIAPCSVLLSRTKGST